MPSSVPVYSSDKRVKFARRENKQWVRLATVFGYVFAVCLPAMALSVYYVGFWDPQYKEKFPPNSTFTLYAVSSMSAAHKTRDGDATDSVNCTQCVDTEADPLINGVVVDNYVLDSNNQSTALS